MGPRYASEPPPLTGQPVYTDVNGHPLDPQQQAATCRVVDPASQVVRQEMASTYQQIQQQQNLQQQQIQQQQLQQQLQQQQVQQQLQQQVQQQQQQLQQVLPPPSTMPVYESTLPVAALPPPAASPVPPPTMPQALAPAEPKKTADPE